MNKFLATMKSGMANFARDEEGAQVVEYALIIAVVSIGLVLGLGAIADGTTFTAFIDRVKACLDGTVCTNVF